LVELRDEFAVPDRLPPGCVGHLSLGVGRHAGQAAGWVGGQVGLKRVPWLNVVGPGMPLLNLLPSDRSTGIAVTPSTVREWWSRTIGALGEETWARLTNLHSAVVGVGRSGSVLAEAIANGWGVERLSLIDPDLIEIHNLGEMLGVTAADRGRPKV